MAILILAACRNPQGLTDSVNFDRRDSLVVDNVLAGLTFYFDHQETFTNPVLSDSIGPSYSRFVASPIMTLEKDTLKSNYGAVIETHVYAKPRTAPLKWDAYLETRLGQFYCQYGPHAGWILKYVRPSGGFLPEEPEYCIDSTAQVGPSTRSQAKVDYFEGKGFEIRGTTGKTVIYYWW